MSNNSGTLYITSVEKQGSFLKVWGQLDRQLPSIIEKSLTQMTSQFESGLFIPTIDVIQCGLLCCAKYKDGAYYRARITNIALLQQNVVEVHFVDYGNRDIVPMANLRTIGNFAPGLITILPQAKDFILGNVTYQGSTWDNDTIALISSEIRYMELTWVLQSQINGYTLIKLFKNGEDFALSLFNRGLVLSIATTAQHMILQNIMPQYQATLSNPTLPSAQVATPPPALLTYKAVSLEPGSENHVYVSYVSDGPCHFSVQLKKLEDTLAHLMRELNRMNLRPLEDDPLPGTVCVARCLEDLHICRAVVTSMVDGQYKVFYVDFGNTEIVPLDNLYQIPFKYVIPKVMAMRYALADLERSSVTLEMKCAFKEFVSNKLLRMRALPPPTRSALPLCMLWDDKDVNVLDVLRKAALLAYPETIQLTRGFSQEVRVSYVHSCSHFYVQIKTKDEELRRVMAELQIKCPYSNPLSPGEVKIGLPCCALFDVDGQWYRAQILAMEGETVKVRYVDYGNEEPVLVSNLRMPPAEQLTALRPQAVECCLNGYQNMADDMERDGLLEDLILEKEFVMKVVEMQGNRALVDLIDGSRYNVGSLLLERLASAKCHVSPLLIQDTHSIEQRKRSSPLQQRLQRRSPHSEYNDDKDKKESWRQPRPPRKEHADERNFGYNRDNGDNFERNKPRRDGFKKDNNWGGNKKDNWGGRDDGAQKGSGEENFKRDKWSGGRDSQGKSNGRSSNQRSGSEKSFSDGGSEKNWRRSPRTNNYHDDKVSKRKHESGSSRNNSTWNTANQAAGFNKVADPAPSSAAFVYPDLVGQCEKVLVSWFHDPAHFFCQLVEFQGEFRAMMNNIQSQYSSIRPTSASVNAPVIALYPEDGVMYRARVLEVKANQYRVQYVDFGNVATTNKLWPIENKVMELPAQAICCSLNELLPVGDKWADPDAFSSYFNKDEFSCTFISSDNGNYSVEITCDNQSISETLISAGLARYADNSVAIGVPDNFELALLLGQQIRVLLRKVHSLDKFYVQLQNGTDIECAMHNLSLATQTHEDVLKQNIGNILIMYVDKVLETRTEVTLYDTSGAKLNIVEPDTGAYDSIEPLCPMPVCYGTISGWISYLKPVEDDKYIVFIQLPEYCNILGDLLEDLADHYKASEDSKVQPVVGLGYAVLSSDGNWYRGQVTKVEDPMVSVIFVDYGNFESVPVSNLRELALEFKQQHLLALELLTSGVDETFIEAAVTANIWYGEDEWEATINKVDQAPLSQELEVTPEQIPEPIEIAQSEPEEILQPEPEEIAKPEPEVISQPQASHIGVPVILSHVDSPGEFYVQLSEDVDTINILQQTLQEQVSSFPDLDTPATGVLCAAPYSIDQQWYRAQVLDADVDITTVRFVDFGNTDVLTDAANCVKTLPADLLSLEQHARRCSLIIKAADFEWSPAAAERFEALTSDKSLSAEIVHQDEKTTYIELFANGENVAETLLREGLAVKLQLETEASCTGYVSHLNSPSEFWVQLENSVADLEWIAEQLSAAENFLELDDLTPGSLCAALFPDDEMWYRVRILSNTVAGLEVLFIDYGNSCTCTGLRQLPEDLIMLSPLAQKCSLQKPSGVLQWSSQATEEFRTISADGATIFNIERLSTGETSIVKLLLNGVDITTQLLAQTEDASVSYFDSISSFWIQKEDQVPKLNTLAEKLAKASGWPAFEQTEPSDSILVGLNEEDGKWYRARVSSINNSEYKVLFIDFGRRATVKDVRVPPLDVSKEAALAIECRLEPLPGFRWNEESSKMFEEISDNGKTVFQVECVAGNSVRLYLNGSDIRANLSSTYVSSAQSTPKKSVAIKSNAEVDDCTNSDSQGMVSPEQNQPTNVTPINEDEELMAAPIQTITDSLQEIALDQSTELAEELTSMENEKNEVVEENNAVQENAAIEAEAEIIKIDEIEEQHEEEKPAADCTPQHSIEEVVPASKCNSDLTEVPANDTSEESVGLSTNLQKTEENENESSVELNSPKPKDEHSISSVLPEPEVPQIEGNTDTLSVVNGVGTNEQIQL